MDIRDIGTGPVTRVVAVCNECNSKCDVSFQGFYPCKTCNAWVQDVHFLRYRTWQECFV